MASIVKRKNNYSVVYRYADQSGKIRQKWETVQTYKEALKRKSEIESQQHNNAFISPTAKTVKELMEEFVTLYGEKKWGLSMYESQIGLIENYINPIIGELNIQKIEPIVVDRYINTLQKTPAVSTKTRKPRTEFVTDKTIEKICKLLHCAFHQAVRWKLIATNPFDDTILPKTEYTKRDIWDINTIRQALQACDSSYYGKLLYVAINLAFACSLRLGEILGLRWKNVFIDDDHIKQDNAYLFIDCELARASKASIERIGTKDIYLVFPHIVPNSKSRLILKKPKTDSSIRQIWLPKTVAYILRDWKKTQESFKAFLGDEFCDYDLVMTLQDGRPCENRIIEREFKILKEKTGLPNVVFHSLRHSSTTYKLKLNHGDIKATQGDTGHSQPSMVTQIYAHILDEDRKVTAARFEDAFYEAARTDLKNSGPPQEEQKPPDLAELIQQLKEHPELVDALAVLISNKTTTVLANS